MERWASSEMTRSKSVGEKRLLVFVVEQQRLDGGDHDLGLAPVVAVFLVDDVL
jgi:hypothetical protein